MLIMIYKARYEAGESLADLATTAGVCVTTMRKQLMAAGVTMRRAGPKRPNCTETTLECRNCKKVKPLDEFHKSVRGFMGKTNICKDCSRDHYAFRTYGITRDQYNAMEVAQSHKCSICSCGVDSPRNNGNKLFCIDHDHATEVVRALLCHHCNCAIGQMNDDRELLERAIAYLETHKTKQPSGVPEG